MQFKLLLLLLIFGKIVSYNNVQSISCHNCTTCTESSPGIILTGCSLCATIVYKAYTQKLCASICIGGSYNGGFLTCCTTNLCNSDTPLSSSLTTCYECSTCYSSSYDSITYGCGACATTVYSTYTRKECVASCSSGSYQGGYKYCCTTNYCNYNTPVACYECSTCSSSSPGSLSYGCGACSTTVYSNYTKKECVQYCSSGSYQGGYKYCCTTSSCNSNTPLSSSLTACFECSSCSSSSPGSLTYGCGACATTVYSTYTQKKCVPSCFPGGNMYCCKNNSCNYNTPLACYECSTCSSSSPGSLSYGCGACSTTVYSNYTQKECVQSCSSGSYQGGYKYCCTTSSCNYKIPLTCYECSSCSSSSPGSLTYGCGACATTVYSTYTQKECVTSCTPGSYQGGYKYCCTNNSCNYNTPLACYECSSCSSSSPGSLTFGCGACATTVYSTYTQKECVSSCSSDSLYGEYKYCCKNNSCNYNTPLSSSLTCYECSKCLSSSPGSLKNGCGACATTEYSTYTRKECVSSCTPGNYQGGYRHCCNQSYCNNNISDLVCYSCSRCLKPFQENDANVTRGCTLCASIDYQTYSHKYCASSCTPQNFDGYKLICCDSNLCNGGYQILTSKQCFICLIVLIIRLLI